MDHTTQGSNTQIESPLITDGNKTNTQYFIPKVLQNPFRQYHLKKGKNVSI